MNYITSRLASASFPFRCRYVVELQLFNGVTSTTENYIGISQISLMAIALKMCGGALFRTNIYESGKEEEENEQWLLYKPDGTLSSVTFSQPV